MSGDALELALALHHAPIRRFALRGRPLPDDIGDLILLASGPQPLLSKTATRLCEAEQTILEAARFYLQQVLFETDADAYRLLGLTSNASAERIREHYRRLQRWLHPDRRGEDWEALFSTRVNWAWQQLRSDSARRAYDTDREPIVAAGCSNIQPAFLEPIEWRAAPSRAPRPDWLKQVAFGVSVCSCVLLLYLAYMHHDLVQHDEFSLEDPGALALVVSANKQDRAVATLSPDAQAPVSRTSPAPPMTPSARLKIDAPRAAAIATPKTRHPAAVSTDTKPATTLPDSPPAPVLVARGSQTELAEVPLPHALGVPTAPAVMAYKNTAYANSQSTAAVVAKMTLARQRIKELVEYFGHSKAASPEIWITADEQVNAERQRVAMRGRNGARGAEFALQRPSWRLTDDAARVNATYRVRGDNNVTEIGRFSVNMVWRERTWQVARIELEPMQ